MLYSILPVLSSTVWHIDISVLTKMQLPAICNTNTTSVDDMYHTKIPVYHKIIFNGIPVFLVLYSVDCKTANAA